MNYRRIYNSIINNRKLNPLNKSIYGENHHIIPRSIGGDDSKHNIIRLSAREHFICHFLLSEMYEKNTYEWYKMNHSFMMMKSMSENQNRYINNRLYELKRKDFSKTMSYSQRGNKNSQYGIERNANTKIKIRKSLFKTLGISGDLTCRQKQELKSKLDIKNHTINDIFINKYRRNVINKIFNINLNNRCQIGFNELKSLLYKLYVVENKSTIIIANEFKTNSETIRNYLSFVGINRKTLSESVRNYYIRT